SVVNSDKCGAVPGHEVIDRHRWTIADLRSNQIRFSENSFLQFDCDCSAVLFEKSIAGLANRFQQTSARSRFQNSTDEAACRAMPSSEGCAVLTDKLLQCHRTAAANLFNE